MTPALIFGIAFGVIFLILLVTIFLLYLGGQALSSTYIFLFILMFFTVMLSASCFAQHIKEINEIKLPPTELRP